MNSKWYENPWVCTHIIIFFSFAVYINSLSGEFIWDDVEQIVENPVIKDIRNIPSFFTSDLWRLIDNPAIGSYYYRPFFLLSLALDYRMWGLNPFGYHVTNLAFHSLNSLMVYLIGRRVLKKNTPSFMAGMLFAVHPVHAESVTWISGRVDPLAFLFSFLSFYFYAIFTEKRKGLYLAVSLSTYFLSLLSKEMAITLPLLLLAYEISLRPSVEFKRGNNLFWILFPYFLITAIYLYLRAIILKGVISDLPAAPFSKRLYTSFGIILEYLRILILPVNLKILYDVPLAESVFQRQVIFSIALLITIIILIIFAYRRDKEIFFASVWFFITILPVTNIVPLRPTMMAERYLYIPSVGICLLLGLVFYRAYVANPSWSLYLKSLMLIILILLSLITFQRNRFWKNEVIYFTKWVKDAPDNAYAHHNLGDAYRKTGEMEQAVSEWEEAVRLEPSHSEANNSLGNIHLLQGNYPEAVRRYRIALQGMPENAGAHYNIAIALEKMGQTEEALFHYRRFITLAPARYKDIVEGVKRRLQL